MSRKQKKPTELVAATAVAACGRAARRSWQPETHPRKLRCTRCRRTISSTTEISERMGVLSRRLGLIQRREPQTDVLYHWLKVLEYREWAHAKGCCYRCRLGVAGEPTVDRLLQFQLVTLLEDREEPVSSSMPWPLGEWRPAAQLAAMLAETVKGAKVPPGLTGSTPAPPPLDGLLNKAAASLLESAQQHEEWVAAGANTQGAPDAG